MRFPCLRPCVSAVLLLIAVAAVPAPATAQPLPPKGAIVVIEPEIRTRIEGALTMSSTVLAADYYKIDMRFGPRVRIDAVIVRALETGRPVKGVRVQVRDETNPDRHFGESFLDIEEVESLTRAIAPMADVAEDWTGYDDRRASEVSFTSAGGFRLSINAFGRVQKATVSTGVRDRVATSIELGDLPTLKVAFDQALAILNGKG